MMIRVVVPTLNELTCLGPCLEAIVAGRPDEVVVVDGGSTDGTPALAAPFADQVIAAPRGRARQMNAGAAASRAPRLLFLHADTRLPADADARVARALARAPWGRFDVRIDGRSRWLPLVAALMNLRSRLTGIATGDQAIFVRRDAFDRIGGFPDQPLMEDVEISRRLRAIGRPACLRARVVTSGRRWDAHGAWRTIRLMWRLRWRYWRGESPQSLAEAYRR
ncbi:MAG: TIGR04283 family arsenosugar biosynthesis glycosyltransferase [Rhodoferax sp.]|nr:TIGR04283 family arsenosugar biosynthesis glycosyltransferase [Rhodoferax sp.]